MVTASGNMNISYDDSDSVASANQIVTLPPNNSISPKEMKPPARKPYMNTGAIDTHQSQFATANNSESPTAAASDEIAFNDTEDETEPRYANIGPKGPLAAQLNYGSSISNAPHSNSKSNANSKEMSDEPIPPYMPMQQQTSKKSTSLEQRIKRKKEKEGCKQQ